MNLEIVPIGQILVRQVYRSGIDHHVTRSVEYAHDAQIPGGRGSVEQCPLSGPWRHTGDIRVDSRVAQPLQGEVGELDIPSDIIVQELRDSAAVSFGFGPGILA